MEEIVGIFKALSDENRYNILRLLLSSDYCVKALAHSLGISESAVSQHLKVLRQANIIDGERKGYFMHYRVNKEVLKSAGIKIISLSETQKKSGTHKCRNKL